MEPIALDTETYLFENGSQAPKIVCLQWDSGIGRNIVIGAAIVPFVRSILEHAIKEKVSIIGANIAYDMAVFGSLDASLIPLIFKTYDAGAIQCVIIRQRLLDICTGSNRGNYGLDDLVQRHAVPMSIDKQNPWRLKYSELDGIPVVEWPPEAVQYAIDDPTATRLVGEAQSVKAQRLFYDSFEAEAARQTSYDFALHLMSCWGMRTQEDRIKKLLKNTKAEIEKLEPTLIAAGVMTAKRTKIMKAIHGRIEKFFNSEDLEIPLTDGKNPKTKADKETIKKCNDPVLKKIVRHSYLVKMKSTYILKLVEGLQGNIHARFHTLGAKTGRTSSSKPNLQNQSRDGGIRECFVPRDGFDFISADYDCQELRTLAQACLDLCGYSTLAKSFQEDPDYDPHTGFASDIMGWEYKDAMKRRNKGDEEVKKKRQEAKAANFGFPGGLGIQTFKVYAQNTWGAQFNDAEAQEIKNQWFVQRPEMQEYFKNAKWVAEAGTLTQLRSGRVRGDVSFCTGANSYFQGLASEASKTAVYLVSKACYAEPDSPLYGCRPVALVHDEIIIEAPSSYSHEAAQELQRLMVIAMEMWCPDIPARATPIISSCWSKNAEPVYDKNTNRLIPWDLEQ